MFWWFCMRFSVFNEFLFLLLLFCLFVCCLFLRFCGGGWFFFLRFLTDPLTDSCFANWKSLFLKLQIFLFVLFRVLNKSRPCLVISSEIVRGILLIVNFFLFSGNKVQLSFSLHTWIYDWKWGECGLKVGVSVPDSLFLPVSALSCINFLIFYWSAFVKISTAL